MILLTPALASELQWLVRCAAIVAIEGTDAPQSVRGRAWR